jgi:hypothetical protein
MTGLPDKQAQKSKKYYCRDSESVVYISTIKDGFELGRCLFAASAPPVYLRTRLSASKQGSNQQRSERMQLWFKTYRIKTMKVFHHSSHLIDSITQLLWHFGILLYLFKG